MTTADVVVIGRAVDNAGAKDRTTANPWEIEFRGITHPTPLADVQNAIPVGIRIVPPKRGLQRGIREVLGAEILLSPDLRSRP